MGILVPKNKLIIPKAPKLKMLPAQMRFLRSRAQQCAFTSGLGGGKSHALRAWSLFQCLQYPDALHCYCSLSYRNMKDSAIPAFAAMLDQTGIKNKWIAGDYMFEINNKTNILFRSQDTADTMRSVEIGSLACDELAYWKEQNFKTLLGRLRDKRGSLQMRAATTTRGFNFFHKYFVKEIKGTNRELIYASSYDNIFLPSDYIKMLEESFDSDMQDQEIRGLFVNTGGRRYYKFRQTEHVYAFDFLPGIPLSVGMDFNVNPMTAVVCQVTDTDIYFHDEFWLKNSNTWEMAEAIKRKYGSVFIIPDAAGNRLQSNATRTDHQILRDAGHQVARVRNPHRKDRFNSTNNLLEKKRIHVHERCEKLAWDFGSCSTDDSDDPESGHITDAAGYAIWYYFPINARNSGDYDDSPKFL